MSRTSECQLCFECEGSLWHRRYECCAHHYKRSIHVSELLATAAANAKAHSEFTAENFARGLFPDVSSLLPKPASSSSMEVTWINRPASGRMSGLIFCDGSGTHPHWPQLRRAGWSVVQVDRFGKMISAAYGPVPFDHAPEQVARDGEDYAVFMCSLVATPPLQIYSDCSGTVRCIRSGPQYSSSPANPRAHLWTKFWAQFEDEDVVGHKTLGHATPRDVEDGKTTWWELHANKEADKLAKAGAAMHAIPPDVLADYFGLVQIVKEAAIWAGTQEAWMDDRKLRDCQSITDPALKESKVDQREVRQIDRSQQDQRAADVWTHELVAAELIPSQLGKVIACKKCGAFAWKRRGKLVEPCRGNPTTQWMRKQKERLDAQLFPGTQQYAIGPLRALSPEELDHLVLYTRDQSASAKQTSSAATQELKSTLSPPQLLAEFGITSNAQLQILVDVSRQRKTHLSDDENDGDQGLDEFD